MSEQNTASLAIIQALGGNIHSGMCCCPLHEDHTPSLHVKAGNDGKALLHCHSNVGCTQDNLVAWCRERGLWHTDTPSNDNWQQQQWAAWEHKKTAEENNSIRLHNAFAILRAAGESADHVAARQRLRPYFNGRGIAQVPPNAMWLDKSKACALADRHPELGLKRFPAMVQPVINDQGRLTGGVLITFLTKDGSKNLVSGETGKKKNTRKTIGLIGGGFVPVGAFPHRDRPLIAAEGVEDAMALAQLTGYAAIATMSAGNMGKLKVPPCSKLIIGCDNDRNNTGRQAAEQLANRYMHGYTHEGGVACIVPPPNEFKDWDEAIRQASDADRRRYYDAIMEAARIAGIVLDRGGKEQCVAAG